MHSHFCPFSTNERRWNLDIYIMLDQTAGPIAERHKCQNSEQKHYCEGEPFCKTRTKIRCCLDNTTTTVQMRRFVSSRMQLNSVVHLTRVDIGTPMQRAPAAPHQATQKNRKAQPLPLRPYPRSRQAQPRGRAAMPDVQALPPWHTAV